MVAALASSRLLWSATCASRLVTSQNRAACLARFSSLTKRFAHISTSPHREDFYEFYLEKLRIKLNGVRTCPWLKGVPSVNAEVAFEALDPELRQDPLSILSSPACDIELVGRCLEAIVLRTHAQTDSRAAARDRISRLKAGSRALHWFLHSRSYETADLALQPRFASCIVHCLTAEKGDDRVMTWMQSTTPEHLADLPNWQAHSWKGMIARQLIENNVFWSNNDMNSAFMPLFKAFMWNIGPPQKPIDQAISL